MLAAIIRTSTVFASGLAALAVSGLAQAQAPDGDWHGSGMWMSGWGGGFLGPLIMLVFLVITIAAIVLIVRWLGGGPYHGSQGGGMPGSTDRTDRALNTLRQRYAQGDISREEFEERRRVLSDD